MRELEFVEEEGMMMINGVVEASSLNREPFNKSNPSISIPELSNGPPLALTILNPGFIDSLMFVEDHKCYRAGPRRGRNRDQVSKNQLPKFACCTWEI